MKNPNEICKNVPVNKERIKMSFTLKQKIPAILILVSHGTNTNNGRYKDSRTPCSCSMGNSKGKKDVMKYRLNNVRL